VSVHLDRERLAQLESVIGAEVGGVLQFLIQSMSSALEEAARALADGELDRTASAAHRFRNDALIIGAKELQSELSELERTAREGRKQPARNAMARVRELWPATVSELERAAAADARD